MKLSECFIIPKHLIQTYGLSRASYIMVLVFEHLLNKGGGDGWFELKQETVVQQYGISTHEQRGFLFELEGLKFIQKERRGVPAKWYYKIDEKRLFSTLKFECLDIKFLMSIIILEDLKDFKDLKYKSMKNLIHQKAPTQKQSKQGTPKYLELFPTEFQQSAKFRFFWYQFSEMRRLELKKPISQISARQIARKLTKAGLRSSIEALEESVERSYRGIFPKTHSDPYLQSKKSLRINPRASDGVLKRASAGKYKHLHEKGV